jgi:filamentous hemagglutinin
MKYNESLKNMPVPLWRRITALVNVLLLTFYTCLPGTVAAYELISDAFIASEINNNPQFYLSTNTSYLAEKAHYVTDTTSTSTQTIASFHQKLLTQRKSSLPTPLMIPIMNDGITIIFPHYALEKQIGDSFVQARFIRSQIFNLLNRNLLNDLIGTEADQINKLYAQAFDFSNKATKRFGEKITRDDVENFGDNFIWPELRTINGQRVLVPVVHLTDDTIDKQLVDSHVVEFNGTETTFNNVTINRGTLTLRHNSQLNVAGNLDINASATLKSSHDLNVLVGGTLQLTSGQITAQSNVNIIAGQYIQKTMVHRYATNNTQGTRLGQIASVDANGNIYIQSLSDIDVYGGTISGNNIALKADGNIRITSQETTHVRNEIVAGWDESESIITQLGSQLTAKENIALVAAGAIEINASTLHADKGTISILAGQGIHILNADNQFQSARSGKFGKNTIQEQEFQSIAIRSALNAGKGIIIDSTFGDIKLQATELTSTTGTQISAHNGATHFLMTKEQKKYFYNKLHEGFWKIKTTTIEDNVETAVYNQVIGGVKVQATKGLTIELAQYENGSTQANGQNTESARISSDIQALKRQIISAKRFGQSTEALDAQIVLLSEALLQAQFSELATADSSLAWMHDVYNDNQYQDNFNLAYQELVEIHKFDKTSTLSPAAMAIIAIAVAVAMGPAGLGAIGANGAIASFTLTPALQAGLLAVANQAAVGLASGHGLEDTTKSLFHSDNIKSTATAMVTAGVLDKLQGSFEYFPVTPELPLTNAQSITNQATQILGNAVVRTGISTVIHGGDLGDFEEAFKSSLAQSLVDRLGKELAGEIAEFKDLAPALRYITHAGLGCLTGSLTSEVSGSNTALGCYSGAGGAVIGEVTADLYLKSIEDETNAVLTKLAAKGDAYTQQELRDIATDLKQKGVDIAKLSAAFAALVLGGNVDIAATAGENAADNNSLSHLVMMLLREWNEPGYHKAELGRIARGEHPAQQLMDKIIAGGVDYVVENVEKETLKTIAAQIDTVEKYSQEYVGQYVDDVITFVYLSDTGQAITAEWNNIPEETRDAWIGAGKVLSIVIPIGKAKYINEVNDAIKVAHKQKVDNYIDNMGAAAVGKAKNVTVIKGFDSLADATLNPELLRSSMDNFVKPNNVRDGYSLSAASIEVNGHTEYLIAVSGKKTLKRNPDSSIPPIVINGVEYNVINKDSGSVREVWNPENEQGNNNHAEKKLMSYMQDNYSDKPAKVTITSQNTNDENPGMCIGCQYSNDNFGLENPTFTINMYHGVKQ